MGRNWAPPLPPEVKSRMKYRVQASGCGRMCVHLDGCTRLGKRPGSLCQRHYNLENPARQKDEADERLDQNDKTEGMLQFATVKRDNKLKAKHFKTVLQRQGSTCANPYGRCLYVKYGVSLPHDVAEVDHILSIRDGGTNCVTNLRVLCACCHTIKTRAANKLPKRKGPDISIKL